MSIKNTLAILFALAYFGLPNQIFAQVLNDECPTAINLTNLTNWCSTVGQYNNIDATDSGMYGLTAVDCFPQADFHDVWFSFVAQANTANITIIGNTNSSSGGTLNDPQFKLYSGSCNNLTEIECSSDNANNNIIEAFAGPLVIGQTYFMLVDGRDGNTGTFQLCINNYNQVPDPQQDCETDVVLCDKSPFTVQSVIGFGVQEIDLGSCMGGESASTWYSWTCDTPGPLAFTLNPNNPSDDLDFIVYELPNGLMDCSDKIILRCMASGENVGAPPSEWAPCTGATGLALSSTDTEEQPGCQGGDDNFVAAIDMESGKSYALVVNNFSNTGNGFAIEFGGSGTFLGPVADFIIDPPQTINCDETNVTFTDASSFASGNIVSWNWNFGAGAMPQTADTQGPHTVIYESIGTKSISLVIESDEGCTITEVLQIDVLECCDPPFDLMASLDSSIDPVCSGDSLGALFLSGNGGNPFYEYSLDGTNFQGGAAFYNLPAGNYEVYIRDIKGCIDSLDASLIDPAPLVVDAGEDVTIVLGGNTDLDAVVSPSTTQGTFTWSPIDSLSCFEDCLDPNTDITNTTTYTISVTNLAGCKDSDDVTVIVEKVRPIYIPNAFSPNYDGINDFFTLYGNVAAESILEFRVFNRWGAQVWEGRNILPGQDRAGWDGFFNGEESQVGVYAFYAVVRFIDGVEILYEGDITLLR